MSAQKDPKSEIEKKKRIIPKECRFCYNCEYWAPEVGTCYNGESYYRADFRMAHDCCKKWVLASGEMREH